MTTFALICDAVMIFVRPVSLKRSNRTGQSGTATTVLIKGVTETKLILPAILCRLNLCHIIYCSFDIVFMFLKTCISNKMIFSQLVLV